MTTLTLLFLLLAAHAAFDYALQGDTVAVNKNPNANTPLQKHVPWYYWLVSHGLTHGGAVCLLTGSVTLGVAEFVCHTAIDFLKCKGLFNIHVDQLLHLLCKLLWVLLWANGIRG